MPNINDIAPLENFRKEKNVLTEKTNLIINNETGEVNSTSLTFKKTVDTRDEFVKLFVENINFLLKLSEGELKILLYALKRIDFSNSFEYTRSFRDFFIKNGVMSEPSFYRHFKSLVGTGVIFECNDEMKKELGIYGNKIYTLNPDVFGKGNFINLKEVKRIIVQKYNFDDKTMVQEISTENTYKETDEVLANMSNYEVKGISQFKNHNNTKIDTDVFIGKKDKTDDIVDIEIKEDVSVKDQPKEIPAEIKASDITNKLDELEKTIQKNNNEFELEKLRNERLKEENENLRLKIRLAELTGNTKI